MSTPTSTQRRAVRIEILHAIRDANGGVWPNSFAEWERVAGRFSVRVLLVPPNTLGSPMMRYDHVFGRGVLYFPYIDDEGLMSYWFVHELSEASMRWEGRSSFRYPAEWGDHHDLALLVENG